MAGTAKISFYPPGKTCVKMCRYKYLCTMRRPFIFYCLIMICCLFICGCTRNTGGVIPAAIPDLLPFSVNPSGPWQVGYSTGNQLTPAQFQFCNYTDTNDSISIWHPNNTQVYPYTGQNTATVTKLHSSGQWALKPHQIAMEGSNTGQFCMLRLVPPVAGNYRVKAVFEGVHFGLSSTDVHVLLNAASLFDGIIEGYGGDPAFHVITGAHPSAVYEGTLHLEKSDVITFAVGYGANKTFYNDTTGLMLIIEIL
jgi:hypothetical protein